jgi:hypothetical protein
MVYDWRTQGKIHWIYKLGVPLVLLKQLTVVPLSQSGIWMQAVMWVEALAGR